MEEPQVRAILAFREQLNDVRRIKAGDHPTKADDLSMPPAVFRKSSLVSASHD